jgi:FKBP-type peptidyl-prolyl cis-trans isomerase
MADEKSTTSTFARVFSLSMAILFLVFASALTIFVVYNALAAHHGQNGAKPATAQQETSKQAQANQPSPKVGKTLQNFQPVDSVKQLQKTTLKQGSGKKVTSDKQTITVAYTGAVAKTGKIFDSSQGKQPVTLPLQNVIKGWRKGVVGMKVGGKRRLLIPANLAYGKNPPPGSHIPKGAPLVFDITLKGVK